MLAIYKITRRLRGLASSTITLYKRKKNPKNILDFIKPLIVKHHLIFEFHPHLSRRHPRRPHHGLAGRRRWFPAAAQPGTARVPAVPVPRPQRAGAVFEGRWHLSGLAVIDNCVLYLMCVRVL